MHKFGMTVCLVLSVMYQAVGTAASDRLPLDLKNQHVVHRGWGLAWPHNAMVSIRKCWQERLLPEVDARLCKERKIFAMHVKDTLPGDYRFTPYGSGHVDFARAISLAKELHIRIFTAELFYREGVEPIAEAKRVNAFIRNYFDREE